ncbi:hypothetical protein OIU78_029228, partial [Salix suchowensis]
MVLAMAVMGFFDHHLLPASFFLTVQTLLGLMFVRRWFSKNLKFLLPELFKDEFCGYGFIMVLEEENRRKKGCYLCMSTLGLLNEAYGIIAAASCSRIKERCRINGVGQFFQSFSTKKGEDEWNDAWETAWLPEDLTAKNRAPWETDVNFSSPTEIEDSETKAFVEEMNDNWDERRKNQPQPQPKNDNDKNGGDSLYNLDTMKKDYRLKKQRIHAGLWTKEIEKQQEAAMNATLGDSSPDDIDRLLDSCS